MPPNRRMEQVQNLLREVGSEVLRRIKDPAVSGCLVSITQVLVTSDLSNARFLVSILPALAPVDPDAEAEAPVVSEKDKQQLVLEALNRASGFVRHEIKSQVRLKRVPVITFDQDMTIALGSKMDRLFEEVRKSAVPES